MQKVSLLEITCVIREMRLAIQPLALLWHLTHPAHRSTISIQDLEILALLSQLLRYGLDINVKVITEELADLGILMIPNQRLSLLRIRRVDIDVCGRVAVRTPPRLRAARDHVCVGVECGQRCVCDGFDFLFRVVVDAEAVGDAVDDEDLLLLVRGRREEVGGVLDGEAFGGVRGVREGRGVPDVVRVGGVEFWELLVFCLRLD
jgi:hypothetical protein